MLINKTKPVTRQVLKDFDLSELPEYLYFELEKRRGYQDYSDFLLALSPGFRMVYLTYWLHNEMGHGGFLQYLESLGLDNGSFVVEALDLLGARKQKALLEEGLVRLRQNQPQVEDPDYEEVSLNDLDNQYWKLDEKFSTSLIGLLARYLERCPKELTDKQIQNLIKLSRASKTLEDVPDSMLHAVAYGLVKKRRPKGISYEEHVGQMSEIIRMIILTFDLEECFSYPTDPGFEHFFPYYGTKVLKQVRASYQILEAEECVDVLNYLVELFTGFSIIGTISDPTLDRRFAEAYENDQVELKRNEVIRESEEELFRK